MEDDFLLSEVSSEYMQTEEESSPENDLSQQNPIGLDLINHPVFSVNEDDEILQIPIQYLKSLILPPNSSQEETSNLAQFEDELLLFIFQDQETIDALKGQEILQKSACGRYFTAGDIYVQCLDCSLDCAYSVPSLCTTCFDRANHENHRLIFTRKEDTHSGTCDCGDPTFIKPEGFCPEHSQVKVDIEMQLQKFPKDIRDRYFIVIKKVLYVVCSAMELFQSSQSKKIWKFGELLLSKLLKVCETCQEDINEAFPLIVAEVLQEKLLEGYDVLLHNCDDTFQQITPIETNNPKNPCHCSLLGNLLRIGNSVSKDQQTQLEKLLVDGTKLPKFKYFLGIEFAKFLDFLYNGKSPKNTAGNQTSALLNLGFQVFHEEEQIEAVFKSGYLKNVTEVMKRFVYKAQELSYNLYKIMSSLNVIIDYFQQAGRKIGHQIIKESSMVSDLLEILRIFQIKFVYTSEIKLGIFEHLVDFKHLAHSLMVEKMVYNSLETILGVIAEMPEEEKKPLIKEFASQWFKEFSLVKAAIGEEIRQQGFLAFSCGLERILACFIQTQKDNLNLREVLPDLNAEAVLEEVLRSFGIIRYFHQTMDGITFHMVQSCYYHISWNYFEIDIMLIQQLLREIPAESVMKLLITNFFSYSSELQQYFQDPTTLSVDFHLKKQLMAIQDFMNFLIFIMTDKLCSLNFDLNLNKAYAKAPPSLSPQQKKSIEDLAANYLLGSYWTTLPELKKGLEFILASTDYLEEIAPNVTIFDEKTQKIRIKDEFLKDNAAADVYIFYKDPVKKQEILSGIISKNKKDNEIDIVSGKVKNDLPQHLQDLQGLFFQSTLPEFLSQFIRYASSETEKSSSIIRPVLRLILLNFQVAQFQGKEIPNLLTKLEQNYFTPDFEENLKKILFSSSSFQDCRFCIEKILALKHQITAVPEKMEIKEETTMITENKNFATTAKERQKKIQEQFLKKQAKFAEKNIDTMEEEILTVKTGKQCQYCLEYIKEESADYGLPIYINFTNNLHPPKSPWWPVLSSCNHYYHKDCFNKLFENSANDLEKPFYSKDETCCTLCKTLCNFFLEVNQQEANGSFFKKIKRVFEDYRLKDPSFKDILPEESLLEKAYDYYLKTDDCDHFLYVLFFKNAILSITEFPLEPSTSLFSGLMTNNEDAIFTKLYEVLLYLKEDDFQKKYLMIIKDILAFKAVQLFSEMQKEKTWTITDLCNFFKENHNDPGSPDLVKILQITLRAFNFNSSLFNSIGEFINTEDNLDILLEKLGFKTNLQDLFQEAVLEIQERPINEIILIESRPNDLQQQSLDRTPQIVTLPATYAEFNSKYFRQKCVLCNGYSSHLNSCICLICGVVVCEKVCDSKGDKKSGNLNLHCKEHHLGTGVFLDKHHLRLILINSPLNVRSNAKELYTDNLGQSILKVLDDSMTVSKIDFKKFTLNKRLAEEIQKIIMTCGIEKELFRVFITGNEKHIRNGLL